MKILRISNVLILLVATVFGILLFWTSQAVQQKEDDLAALKKHLGSEKEAIRVLSVEWDYLNRPDRLEELAVKELGMKAVSAKEVVTAAGDIPEPFIPAVDTDVLMQENITHEVSLQAPVAQPSRAPVAKAEIVSPSKAEKNSFEQLIQSLDLEGEGAR